MELLNARQVAKIQNCAASSVYKMAERGLLPCVKWQIASGEGRKERPLLRFKADDVLEFIENHRMTS